MGRKYHFQPSKIRKLELLRVSYVAKKIRNTNCLLMSLLHLLKTSSRSSREELGHGNQFKLKGSKISSPRPSVHRTWPVLTAAPRSAFSLLTWIKIGWVSLSVRQDVTRSEYEGARVRGTSKILSYARLIWNSSLLAELSFIPGVAIQSISVWRIIARGEFPIRKAPNWVE